MSNKIEDFRRINLPRVDRALGQIKCIRKSAKSMKVDDVAINILMQPIIQIALDMQIDSAKPESEEVMTEVIQKEHSNIKELSTQQLVDRMIACGAELSKRRQ